VRVAALFMLLTHVLYYQKLSITSRDTFKKSWMFSYLGNLLPGQTVQFGQDVSSENTSSLRFPLLIKQSSIRNLELSGVLTVVVSTNLCHKSVKVKKAVIPHT
jgi:hypothetical protein